MKLKNVAVVAAALALAVGMTACGGSASSTTASSVASSVASSAAASSEAASSEAASSEAEVEPAEYTVYNTTGENVTELYLYVAGSEDKGEQPGSRPCPQRTSPSCTCTLPALRTRARTWLLTAWLTATALC